MRYLNTGLRLNDKKREIYKVKLHIVRFFSFIINKRAFTTFSIMAFFLLNQDKNHIAQLAMWSKNVIYSYFASPVLLL